MFWFVTQDIEGGRGDRGVARREADLTAQTRTPSLFMCFGGERRLGIRLRRAESHRKVQLFFLRIFPSYLPMRPRAPQPNPQSSLTPKTHK